MLITCNIKQGNEDDGQMLLCNQAHKATEEGLFDDQIKNSQLKIK